MNFSKRILEITAAVIAGIVLLGSGFWFGWSTGRKVPVSITISEVSHIGTPTSTGADFRLFWQAWQIINDDYLRNPSTTPQQKVYGAISGLVGSLGDPYSEFFEPETNQQFQENISGNFGGIGARLTIDANGRLVIITPLKGTPAERAGLLPKDWIVTIGATSTDGMTVDKAVSLIRGSIDSVVTLGVFRDGWLAPRDFKIARESIQIPNVEFEMKGSIAHITLAEFTQDAEPAFYRALVRALSENAKGIVLDLRNDPGGYLEVAVDLAGYFLKPNTLIVKEVGRSIEDKEYRAFGDGALSEFPIVVLINSGSASAAEILAGALHDQRNVKLVGEKSYGKGTVQQLEPLPDGSAIKLTIAHWVLPSGRILDHDGLIPEYAVTSTEEDIAAGNDSQLTKALEVLSTQIR